MGDIALDRPLAQSGEQATLPYYFSQRPRVILDRG
jgi:hypothetical protein